MELKGQPGIFNLELSIQLKQIIDFLFLAEHQLIPFTELIFQVAHEFVQLGLFLQ